MATDVSSIYGGNTSYFREIKDRAFSALSRLETVALNSTYAKYSAVQVSDPGEMERLDISGLPTVQEVMGSVQSIAVDPFPTPPSNDELVKYKAHVWESAQLDSIQSTLMAMVSSAGMPDTAFQDAIFEADKERKQKVLSESIDMIQAKTSARGFKYANGQTNAAILSLMEKHQFDQENQSREITKQMTEWCRQNLQFSIQQGVGLEQAHMDFAYKYSSIFREIYTTLIQSVLEKYRTQVQMEMTKLEAITKATLMRGDVLKANADITATEAKINMERDQLNIQQALAVYNGTIQQATHIASQQIEAASKEAAVSGELVKAVSSSVIGLVK